MIIKKRRVIPYPDPRPAGTDSRMTVKKRLAISNVLMILVPGGDHAADRRRLRGH
jgi:hypothetical protein